MRILATIGGLLLLSVILWDAFETIILPRRVTRRFRLARLVYRTTWLPWSAIARRMRAGSWRESFLSFYGPLSLLWLFGFWVVALIASFALLQWGLGSGFIVVNGTTDFSADLYMSGTTFFTLGLGDVTPRTPHATGLGCDNIPEPLSYSRALRPPRGQLSFAHWAGNVHPRSFRVHGSRSQRGIATRLHPGPEPSGVPVCTTAFSSGAARFRRFFQGACL